MNIMILSCVQRAKIYETFDERLFDLGILTDWMGYYDSNFFDITIKYIRDQVNCRKIFEQHHSELQELFVRLWREQGGHIDLAKYGTPEYLSFNVHTLQEAAICKLVGANKANIRDVICRLLPSGITPEHFFVHSSDFDHGYCPAGYHVVLANSMDFSRVGSTIQASILDACIKYLKSVDKEGMFQGEYLCIGYHDLSACDYLYFMGRED